MLKRICIVDYTLQKKFIDQKELVDEKYFYSFVIFWS